MLQRWRLTSLAYQKSLNSSTTDSSSSVVIDVSTAKSITVPFIVNRFTEPDILKLISEMCYNSRRARRPRLRIFVASLPFCAFAQAVTPEAEQNIDKAHESLVKPKPKASSTAESLTYQAAALRPAKSIGGPVRRVNFIDEHIFGRIEQDGVPHAGVAADEEFARRAWLDATGRIPPVHELNAFLNDKDPEKREQA